MLLRAEAALNRGGHTQSLSSTLAPSSRSEAAQEQAVWALDILASARDAMDDDVTEKLSAAGAIEPLMKLVSSGSEAAKKLAAGLLDHLEADAAARKDAVGLKREL